MDENDFPGKQTDERILYFTRQHPTVNFFSFSRAFVFAVLLVFTFWVLSSVVNSSLILFVGLAVVVVVLVGGWWWCSEVYKKTALYITDRRVIKFFSLSPFHKRTRALFWDEAVKSKTYHKHSFLEGLFGIGSIEVHARSEDKDNVDFDNLIYYEDLSNYIDKIIFAFKNQPADLGGFRPFVPRPKGQRY